MPPLPPVSLYVHIPWCIRKCPYCDFNSHAFEDSFPESEYIDALLQDFLQDQIYIHGRELQSIFFGGGTPSLLSPESLHRFLAGASEIATFSPTIEISLEANPGTTDAVKFREYHSAGVNRLSIGIQSFDDKQLLNLGRVHDGRQARQAIETARLAGFDNLNLDLMHGLPHQDSTSALSDLEIAIGYGVPHVSWYQLTIEPNTSFYSQPPELPAENDLWSIHKAGTEYLSRYLDQYEVSAYSKAGYRCQHNVNYWSFGDYVGIGAGAHGKLTSADFARIVRTAKTRAPDHYLHRVGGRHPVDQPTKRAFGTTKQIEISDLPLEFMMNCLRLKSGLPDALFADRTGLPLTSVADFLRRNRKRGLLRKGSRIQTTAQGFRYLNSVLEDLL
jgi:putative oxygen-independent coproporphyrinogen III oxidase